MVSDLQIILETLIGKYEYGLAKFQDGSPVCGVAGLDWAYIGRYLLVALTLYMTFKLMYEIVKRMFGVLK